MVIVPSWLRGPRRRPTRVGASSPASRISRSTRPFGEWFRENSPGETELRTAILGWIDPCKEDGCWLTRGKVFLAMSQVDDLRREEKR